MPPIAAIVLAAGQSKRMGRSKQLLSYGGKPVIRHCLDALLAGGLEKIVVVLGSTGAAIEPVIGNLPVTVVWNRAAASDMADSVRAGLAALAGDVAGVLVCLADHFLVKVATLQTIMQAHAEHPDKIIIPVCQGRKGHPTLFPRPVLEEITTLPTLRHIINSESGRTLLLAVGDPAVTLDMDTPEDFRRIVAGGSAGKW
ncbi:MAG: nucleotidyltransferase family protein [Deltaproteobacteria bacterium]|nr:nucleotidyltransferase family protein [Deltaproteobacteria bacterium]